MLKNGTNYQVFPLQSGGVDAPAFTPGQATSFALDAVPIQNGNRANYLLGILVTIAGVFTQPNVTTNAEVFWDGFFHALVSTVDVRNTWFGSPFNSQHALGAYWPIIEFVGCGYRYPIRRKGSFPSTANKTYSFTYTFMVPLCRGTNKKPHKTAQLMLLYKKAQLVLQAAPASVIQGMSSSTASLSGMTIMASAVLSAHRSIWMAPGLEWIDYTNTAAIAQNQIPLLNFGNVTNLNNTKANAGIAWMGAITNAGGAANGLPGSFDAAALTAYQFPFLGQYQTQQPASIVAMQLMAMGVSRPVLGTHVQAPLAADKPSDIGGFPYIQDTDVNFNAGAPNDMTGLMAFIMMCQGSEGEDSKLWQAYGDQSYVLQGPGFSGSNHTLVQHVRQWEENRVDEFAVEVIKSGLATAVLGTTDLDKKLATFDKSVSEIEEGKALYLPVEFTGKGKAHVA